MSAKTHAQISRGAGQLAVIEQLPEELRARSERAERHALTILETIQDGFIGLDHQWRIAYLNAAAERMMNSSRVALLDQNFWAAVPAAIGTRLEKEARRVMADHTPAEFSDYFLPPDRYYRVLVNSCEDGVMILLQDITESQQLREALEESEAWRRLIIENVKEFAIFSMDQVGRITLWNPGAEKLFGYSASEILGQTATALYTPEDRAQGLEQKERTAAAETGHALDERWHLRKDGSRVFVSGAAVPLYDQEGKLRGFTKVARDITQRKQLEDELITAREHLETTVAERTASLQETVAQLEAFSYSLSHDMRTPLRAMRSFSQILAMKLSSKVDAEDRNYLQRIITAAERLDRLIQDVLSYSRLARGEIRLESVDVESMITEMIHEHPSLEPSKALITIQSRLLPVLAHPASLAQVLSNLLTNAVKFVAPGSFPRIRIRTEVRDSQVRLWIEDNGIGIPPADQARIFGMFQRLHTDEKYEGTGIGLAIVRKAVERMQGEVGVESEPGKGSRFWVQLPKGTTP